MYVEARASEEVYPLPRYGQIFHSLRGSIAGGTYPVGAALPTEAELCTEFGVSRFTVREALRRLVEIGMIGRRKGSGSYVTATTPQVGYVQSMRSLSQLFQYALDTNFEISRVRTVNIDAEIAEALVADVGTKWLSAQGVRRVRGTSAAICFTRVFVDNRFAPLLADIRSLRTPIYAAIEERSGEIVAEAVQEIRAVRIAKDISSALGEPNNTLCLLVRRRYVGRDGATLLCSFNWHPADRFRYTMHIQRGAFSALHA
jgi:GntR family transcriptional regulator